MAISSCGFAQRPLTSKKSQGEAEGRIATGVPALDTMTHGGLPGGGSTGLWPLRSPSVVSRSRTKLKARAGLLGWSAMRGQKIERPEPQVNRLSDRRSWQK